MQMAFLLLIVWFKYKKWMFYIVYTINSIE